jgi:outer membrane usher protein
MYNSRGSLGRPRRFPGRRWPLVLSLALLPTQGPRAADGTAPAPAAAASAPAPAPPPRPADPRSRDQLFEQVFRRPPPAIAVSGYAQVSVDGARAQKLRAVLAPQAQALRIEGRALLTLLTGLKPPVLSGLEQAVDGEGWLSGAAIEAAGILLQYDARRFTLALTTDPKLRDRTVRYLSGPPPSAAGALRPARFSGFLNLNARAVRRDDTLPGFGRDGSELVVAADGALNFRGVVLEGSGIAQSHDSHGFQRGDTRLVFDQPAQAVRYSAGDLRYPLVGFQTVVPMGGIGVARDFSLQPYRRSYQASQFEFYLERPSVVQVWVNGSLVTTLQLPAGLHDLRGLSAIVGINNTKLVIEDASGRVQTLDFSFIYSPLLLGAGERLFTLNAGVKRQVRDGRYHYEGGEPVVVASYLQGITGNTTMGGYLQSDGSRAVAGAQATYALAYGAVQLDGALRHTGGAPAGAGARLNLFYIGGPGAPLAVQGQVGLEWLGPHFGSVNELVTSDHGRVNLFGSVAVPLGPQDALQFSGFSTPALLPGTRGTHSATAAWTHRLGRATLTLGLRHRRTTTGEQDRGAFFGLSYAFAEGAQNFQVAREPETGVGSASWNSTRPTLEGGPYGFASARLGSGTREYTAGAGYWTHQGLVEAAHTRGRIETPTGRFTREESSLRGQSALVFADGVMALTPQVTENFVIVRGKEGLEGVPIRIDPDGNGGSRGRSAWLSPAVLSDLGSYLVRDIRVEPVDPPIGAAPDKLGYAVAAAYKSGALLELGKESRTIAVGRLLDAARQGLAHVPLEVRRLGAPADAPPLRTFTSRTGSFQLPDLRPGRYEIAPQGPRPFNTLIVDIPRAPDGLHRLGDIVVQ